MPSRRLGSIVTPGSARTASTTLIESLGGTLETFYFAIGETDAYVIIDVPDNVSAAAIAIAFAAGGAVANIQTTPLMTVAETVQALRTAGTCGYKSVLADKAAAAGG